jgi:hypothetical protein
MKIVQTLWTKPGLNASWLDTRFHYLSWALSCLQLRKYYNDVELYTDEVGKYLLIDKFKLPYTKVHLTLDNLENPTYLWGIPKLLTYSMQTTPFLHIDGDVFLYKKIPEDFVRDTDFIFQNEEIDSNTEDGFYSEMFNNLFSIKPQEQFPEWMRAIDRNCIKAFNAGVLGGSNLAFIKEYTDAAFSFLDKERPSIEKMRAPQLATHMSEQVLPAYIKKNSKFKQAALFEPDTSPGFSPSIINRDFDEDNFPYCPLPYDYHHLDEFGISPHGRKYVHLTGTKKRSMLVCKQVSRRLMADYPEYYHRIIDFFNTTHITHPLAYSSLIGDIKNTGSSFEEKRSLLQAKNVFRRTLKMCKFFGIKADPSISDVRDFEIWLDTLQELTSEDQWMQLKDLSSYELARYEFSKNINNELLHEVDEMSKKSADVITSIHQMSDDQLVLRTHPQARIISTLGDWWDGYVYLRKYITESSVNMLIFPERITHSIVELRISEIDVEMLEAFKDGNTMLQVYNTCYEGSKQGFFKNILYLISNGILFIDDNRAVPMNPEENRKQNVTVS